MVIKQRDSGVSGKSSREIAAQEADGTAHTARCLGVRALGHSHGSWPGNSSPPPPTRGPPISCLAHARCACLPQRSDPQLLAQFYYADEELNQVAAELDSLDGRKDPQRCTLLVSQFRSCQVSAVRPVLGEVRSRRRSP